MKTINFEDYFNQVKQDPKYFDVFNKYNIGLEIGNMVFRARLFKGVTQDELAKSIGTKQSSIARLEKGRNLPSLTFLQKIAEAFGTYLLAPKFAFFERSITFSETKNFNVNTNIIINQSNTDRNTDTDVFALNTNKTEATKFLYNY